jgi:hypothetical protein
MKNESPSEHDQPEDLPPPLPAAPPIAPPMIASPGPSSARGFSRTQLALAFAVAALSDVISAFTSIVPPIEWAVDLVTALLLFVLLGWRWLLLPALIAEAIPGVAAFPFWVLVVAVIALRGTTGQKRILGQNALEKR